MGDPGKINSGIQEDTGIYGRVDRFRAYIERSTEDTGRPGRGTGRCLGDLGKIQGKSGRDTGRSGEATRKSEGDGERSGMRDLCKIL
jgi:hypothetical protein